jgi:hypothetical protein
VDDLTTVKDLETALRAMGATMSARFNGPFCLVVVTQEGFAIGSGYDCDMVAAIRSAVFMARKSRAIQPSV